MTENSKSNEGQAPQGLNNINFSTFVLSLGTSAMINLGEIENPANQKKETDLNMAKQTIDILIMLKEKTKGNLDGQEEKLFEEILHNLRMSYVRE